MVVEHESGSSNSRRYEYGIQTVWLIVMTDAEFLATCDERPKIVPKVGFDNVMNYNGYRDRDR